MPSANPNSLPIEETDRLLAAWTPLGAPDFQPQMPGRDDAYVPEVKAFFDAASTSALLHPDHLAPDPRALFDDWRLLDAAEPRQIRALLTFMVRSEELASGAHGEFITTGEAGAVMRRIRELHRPPAGSAGTLRLVAWNMRCQTRPRPLPAACSRALRSWVPDVIVLNEYVHDESRAGLLDELSRIGLDHVAWSTRIGRHNQVLVASRFPFQTGLLQGPDIEGGAGRSNFLHIHLERFDVSVVGLRAPMYTGETLQRYWNDLAGSVRSRPERTVWVGDFNCDPDSPRGPGGKTLNMLEAEGFLIPRPRDPWSFFKGSRIDHTLVSPDLKVLTARYLTHAAGITVVGADQGHVSDHAAVFIELDRHVIAA